MALAQCSELSWTCCPIYLFLLHFRPSPQLLTETTSLFICSNPCFSVRLLSLSVTHTPITSHIMPPPASKPKPPQKLEFTMNSLRNTTLSTGDDSLYFEIVTRYWHPNLTKINKFDMESRELLTVAEIEGLQTRDPRVRFGGDKGHWMTAGDFLKYDNEHMCVHSSFISPGRAGEVLTVDALTL